MSDGLLGTGTALTFDSTVIPHIRNAALRKAISEISEIVADHASPLTAITSTDYEITFDAILPATGAKTVIDKILGITDGVTTTLVAGTGTGAVTFSSSDSQSRDAEISIPAGGFCAISGTIKLAAAPTTAEAA